LPLARVPRTESRTTTVGVKNEVRRVTLPPRRPRMLALRRARHCRTMRETWRNTDIAFGRLRRVWLYCSPQVAARLPRWRASSRTNRHQVGAIVGPPLAEDRTLAGRRARRHSMWYQDCKPAWTERDGRGAAGGAGWPVAENRPRRTHCPDPEIGAGSGLDTLRPHLALVQRVHGRVGRAAECAGEGGRVLCHRVDTGAVGRVWVGKDVFMCL